MEVVKDTASPDEKVTRDLNVADCRVSSGTDKLLNPGEVEVVPADILTDQQKVQYVNKKTVRKSLPSILDSIDDQMETSDPLFVQYTQVFNHFAPLEEVEQPNPEPKKKEEGQSEGDLYRNEGDEEPVITDEDFRKGLSKKQLKKLRRPTVSLVRFAVDTTLLVEMDDCNPPDPIFLVHLKAYRNTDQIPTHWREVRNYLSSKRDVPKLSYELPKYIQDTGIQSLLESNDTFLRRRMQENVRPKLGKLNLDYQKLHDAFFKYQAKPLLTKFGEIYYEGKEHNTNMNTRRPGELSDEL